MPDALSRPPTATTVVLLVTAVLGAVPHWNALLAELATLRETAGQLLRETQRHHDMEGWQSPFLASAQAKGAVVRALLDGRLTLPEAAARFRDLNRSNAWHGRHGRSYLPGRSEEERVCREVIQWTSSELAGLAPAAAAAVKGQLDAELEEHLNCCGTVPLPE